MEDERLGRHAPIVLIRCVEVVLSSRMPGSGLSGFVTRYRLVATPASGSTSLKAEALEQKCLLHRIQRKYVSIPKSAF